MKMKQAIEKAREIRQAAADYWGCLPREIDWSSCVGMALRGENLPWLETETETETEAETETEKLYLHPTGKCRSEIEGDAGKRPIDYTTPKDDKEAKEAKGTQEVLYLGYTSRGDSVVRIGEQVYIEVACGLNTHYYRFDGELVDWAGYENEKKQEVVDQAAAIDEPEQLTNVSYYEQFVTFEDGTKVIVGAGPEKENLPVTPCYFCKGKGTRENGNTCRQCGGRGV